MMGSLIGVITRCGGMQGLIEFVSPLASTRRRGQLTAWLLGLVVFFDDYANTILLGGTLRPICDRLKISREKLAYLVDSTAAPVAGLALVSTWVAVEIEYVRNGLNNIESDLGQNAFNLFLASIPYRFYIIMALLFVPLTAILGRDFGAMLKAERRRLQSDSIDSRHPDSGTLEPAQKSELVLRHRAHSRFGVGLRLLYVENWTCGGRARSSAVDVFGNSASSLSLQYGALIGLATAALMARLGKLLDGKEVVEAIAAGAKVVAPAIFILWCASAISSMTGNSSFDGKDSETPYEYKNHRLYTGEYLKVVLNWRRDRGRRWRCIRQTYFSVKLLPTVVFVLPRSLHSRQEQAGVRWES